MNYKISLAALAVAATVSGQAAATLSTAENAALAALITGPTGIAAGWTSSIDGATSLTQTGAWVAGGADSECTWRGIVCDGGTTGNITHVEIPNTGLADMTAALAALTPAASSLIVLNLSNASPAESTPNALTGSMAGLSAFTALTHLAINNAGIVGAFPDMTDAVSLNWISVADSAGITSMTGKLAGGTAITHLVANNTENFVGDLSSTLANVSTVAAVNVTVDDSKLSGSLVTKTGDTISVANSDVIVTGDVLGGYVASAVIQPVASVTLNSAGEETATFSWIAPTVTGEETGVNVSYTADDGATLEGTTAGAATSHTFTGMDAGAYKAVVQSTGPDGRMSAAVLSDSFTVTAATVTQPLTCELPEVLNEAEDACIDPVVEPVASSGGGGAALWLVMLPLMGLFRRKRA